MLARSSGELKLYAWIVVGFVVCLGLTQWFLPALGLGGLAQRIEDPANTAAPYLLTPLVLLLVLRLWHRQWLAALLGALGWVVMDYFFFRHYELSLAVVGLVLIGLATALGATRSARSTTLGRM